MSETEYKSLVIMVLCFVVVMGVFVLIGAIPATYVVWAIWNMVTHNVGAPDYFKLRVIMSIIFGLCGLGSSVVISFMTLLQHLVLKKLKKGKE